MTPKENRNENLPKLISGIFGKKIMGTHCNALPLIELIKTKFLKLICEKVLTEIRMTSKAQSNFYKWVKVLHKFGIFIGVLAFTFDGKRNRVKRSRALEVYSCFLAFLNITCLLIFYAELCNIHANNYHLDSNARTILIVLNIISFSAYIGLQPASHRGSH
jgi:hypothetical protein